MIIQNKIPEFQVLIRERFPIFETGIPLTTMGSLAAQTPKELYEWGFSSEDDTARIRIATNRIVLVTTNYRTFEEFSTDIFEYFDKFFDLCNISRV